MLRSVQRSNGQAIGPVFSTRCGPQQGQFLMFCLFHCVENAEPTADANPSN
jgi:hypothetical protein